MAVVNGKIWYSRNGRKTSPLRETRSHLLFFSPQILWTRFLKKLLDWSQPFSQRWLDVIWILFVFFFHFYEISACPDLFVILYDPFCVVKLSGTIHETNVKFSDDRLKLNKITFLFPKGTKRWSSIGCENLEWNFSAKCCHVFIYNLFFLWNTFWIIINTK